MVEESRVPRTLYKYYPDSSLEYIFKNWTIRFTPAIAFNDPFECLPHVKSLAQKEYIENVVFGNIDDILKEETTNINGIDVNIVRELMQKKENKKIVKDYVGSSAVYAGKFAMQKIYEKASREIGVFCLSEEKLNLLMWSHYANSHRGFVVGFNMESEFFSNGYALPIWKPRKIDYVLERPSKFLNEFSPDMKEIFYTKGKVWDYEKEWRMLAPLELPLAWVEGSVKGVHPLPRIAVSEVIFGGRLRDDEVKLLCQIIKKIPGCDHIRLQWTKLHDSRYELVLEDIPPSFWQKKN